MSSPRNGYGQCFGDAAAGIAGTVRAAILAESPDQRPLHLVRSAFLKLAVQFSAEQAVAIDRILRSTERLRATNQAKFLFMQKAVLEALSQHWAKARPRKALQVVAMLLPGLCAFPLTHGPTKPLASFIARGSIQWTRVAQDIGLKPL